MVRAMLAVFAALWLAWPAAAVYAEEAAVQTEEAELKTAFLYNFLKLAEWPEAAGNDPMDVCLARHDSFAGALSMLQNREVQGKQVRVRVLESGQSPAGCRLLFIPGDEKAVAAQAWLAAAAEMAVLTVSDRPGFIGQGGMIGLFTEDSKLRFEINLESVLRHRLKLRAQLLQLAVRVEGIPP